MDSSKDYILRLFVAGGPRAPTEPLSYEHIAAALAEVMPSKTASARLSELTREGILEKVGHGSYQLAVAKQDDTPPSLQRLANVLRAALPSRALHAVIIWDATPILASTEDGVTGQHFVVEVPRQTGGATGAEIERNWPSKEPSNVREWAYRDDAMAELAGVPRRRPIVSVANASQANVNVHVAPAEGHYAATILTPAGHRIATRERIATDFMQLPGNLARDAFERLICHTKTPLQFGQLLAAARDRHDHARLLGWLGVLRGRLPRELASDFDAYLRREKRR